MKGIAHSFFLWFTESAKVSSQTFGRLVCRLVLRVLLLTVETSLLTSTVTLSDSLDRDFHTSPETSAACTYVFLFNSRYTSLTKEENFLFGLLVFSSASKLEKMFYRRLRLNFAPYLLRHYLYFCYLSLL